MVSGAEEFSGMQLSLQQKTLVAYNVATLSKLVERLKTVTYPNIQEHYAVWIFNFTNVVSQIQAKSSLLDSTGLTQTLKNNLLELLFPTGIKVAFTFHWKVSLGGLSLLAGTGTALITASNAKFRQEYLAVRPNTNLTAELKLAEIVVQGGLLESLVSEGVKQLVASGLNMQLTSVIKASLNNYTRELDENMLVPYVELKVPFSSHNVTIRNYFQQAATKQDKDEVAQVFFFDSAVAIREKNCKGPIWTLNPYIPSTTQGKTQRLCYHNELFTAVLEAQAACNYRNDLVNLAEWKLTGKAGELFNLLPSLADTYTPSEVYHIKRKLVPELRFIVSEPPTVEFKKDYIFTINRTSEVVLTINTKFHVTLHTSCSTPQCTAFVCVQKTALLKEYVATPALDPFSKMTMNSLLLHEIKTFVDQPLFESAIPVPPPIPGLLGLPEAPHAGGVCVEYPL